MAQLTIPLDAKRFATGLTWKDYMAQMGDTRARTLGAVPQGASKEQQDAAMNEFRKQVQAEYDKPGGALWRAAAAEVKLLLEARAKK